MSKPKELVGKIYYYILEYIHTEIPNTAISSKTSDWVAQGHGDIGTIALRTSLSIDKLVGDALDYAYQETGFLTQPKKPTPTTPEIGGFTVEKESEKYTAIISRRASIFPYIIKITKSL